MYTKWLVSVRSYVTHNYRETEVLFHEEFPLLHASINITCISFLNILIPAQYRPPIPTPDTKPGYPQHRPLPSPSIPKHIKIEKLNFRSPIYRLSCLPISKEKKLNYYWELDVNVSSSSPKSRDLSHGSQFSADSPHPSVQIEKIVFQMNINIKSHLVPTRSAPPSPPRASFPNR